MAPQRRVLRIAKDVALIEETASILVPEARINTAYVVTSSRIPGGAYFETLGAAIEEFEREVAKSTKGPDLR
jgi:hypothetical protein